MRTILDFRCFRQVFYLSTMLVYFSNNFEISYILFFFTKMIFPGTYDLKPYLFWLWYWMSSFRFLSIFLNCLVWSFLYRLVYNQYPCQKISPQVFFPATEWILYLYSETALSNIFLIFFNVPVWELNFLLQVKLKTHWSYVWILFQFIDDI